MALRRRSCTFPARTPGHGTCSRRSTRRYTVIPSVADGPTVRTVECGTDSTSIQIVGGRLLGWKGTRGTFSARSGTPCLSRLPMHVRCIRAGQAGV